MVGYGKMAQSGVAVVSYLAERYADDAVVSSAEVAAARNPKPATFIHSSLVGLFAPYPNVCSEQEQKQFIQDL